LERGQKQDDGSLEVWVVVDEVDEPARKALVGEFAALLVQESIYFERINSTVEFIPPTAEE
jgi:hypothetical protein